MSGSIGRKARLFQTVVRQTRRRQQSEAAPAARQADEMKTDEIKANEVEEMRRKLETAFGAVDTA